MEEKEILGRLDDHIRQWRENFTHDDERLRNRAIDAVDALQQFRRQAFGSLLPQDDGTFGVFTEHGKSGLTTVGTEAEARAIVKTDIEECALIHVAVWDARQNEPELLAGLRDQLMKFSADTRQKALVLAIEQNPRHASRFVVGSDNG